MQGRKRIFAALLCLLLTLLVLPRLTPLLSATVIAENVHELPDTAPPTMLPRRAEVAAPSPTNVTSTPLLASDNSLNK